MTQLKLPVSIENTNDNFSLYTAVCYEKWLVYILCQWILDMICSWNTKYVSCNRKKYCPVSPNKINVFIIVCVCMCVCACMYMYSWMCMHTYSYVYIMPTCIHVWIYFVIYVRIIPEGDFFVGIFEFYILKPHDRKHEYH